MVCFKKGFLLKKGVTLIEVLIAMLILVLIIISTLMALSTYNKISLKNEQAFVADNLATSKIEILNGLDRGDAIAQCTAKDTVVNNVTYSFSYDIKKKIPITGTGATYDRVLISVTFNNNTQKYMMVVN